MTERASKPLAWITGAGGLIGNYVAQTAARFAPNWEIRALTRGDLDLLAPSAVTAAFRSDAPQLVIHCAALTQTPACQKQPDLARRLNVEVTDLLCQLAADIPLLFFSTDLVFDGKKGNYVETDPVNPMSVYAETKVTAEQMVLSNPKHTVIRTSLNGGTSPTGDRGFNEQLRHAFARGEKLTLFTDEYRCPIPAEVTAHAVWEFVHRNQAGLYHVAGSERLSRWQIGQLIAARWPQLNPQIAPESLSTYRGAPRSPDTSLNIAKAQAVLSFPLPGLSHWLRAHPEEVF